MQTTLTHTHTQVLYKQKTKLREREWEKISIWQTDGQRGRRRERTTEIKRREGEAKKAARANTQEKIPTNINKYAYIYIFIYVNYLEIHPRCSIFTLFMWLKGRIKREKTRNGNTATFFIQDEIVYGENFVKLKLRYHQHSPRCSHSRFCVPPCPSICR